MLSFVICQSATKAKMGSTFIDSSTLSLTSALDGASGQRHAPAALPPGKSRYPLYRRPAGPQGRSGRLESHSVHRNSAESRSCVYLYRREGVGLTGTQLT